MSYFFTGWLLFSFHITRELCVYKACLVWIRDGDLGPYTILQIFIPILVTGEDAGNIEVLFSTGMSSFIIIYREYSRYPCLDAVNRTLLCNPANADEDRRRFLLGSLVKCVEANRIDGALADEGDDG